jgi:predicted  nucleic acid-binding Zn-ribbon protein
MKMEDRQKNSRRTYKIQHCMAAGNPDVQAALTSAMEEISEDLASLLSGIATIRNHETVLSAELVAKKQRLLIFGNDDSNDQDETTPLA